MVEDLNSWIFFRDGYRIIDAATVTKDESVDRDFPVDGAQVCFPEFIGVNNRDNNIDRLIAIFLPAVNKWRQAKILLKD